MTSRPPWAMKGSADSRGWCCHAFTWGGKVPSRRFHVTVHDKAHITPHPPAKPPSKFGIKTLSDPAFYMRIFGNENGGEGNGTKARWDPDPNAVPYRDSRSIRQGGIRHINAVIVGMRPSSYLVQSFQSANLSLRLLNGLIADGIVDTDLQLLYRPLNTGFFYWFPGGGNSPWYLSHNCRLL
ncbi:hypothetical protein I7I51_08499 [Histoplasma capsulatum]|uniref:Uncharacterized protein n=1 Tax=Ajellomyces capsulatus TaxID=5037 RepID=A0A8A1M4F1_AJECA|nr:hypothetical protein I7I51_08499 [Histoplasma capsulatum]